VELNGEDLSCYSNKTEPVSLRKCPYDHWLTNKAYLSDITVIDISRSFTHKMAAKINWHRYGTKLRHYHSIYNSAALMLCLAANCNYARKANVRPEPKKNARETVRPFLRGLPVYPTHTDTDRPRNVRHSLELPMVSWRDCVTNATRRIYSRTVM